MDLAKMKFCQPDVLAKNTICQPAGKRERKFAALSLAQAHPPSLMADFPRAPVHLAPIQAAYCYIAARRFHL